jgi:uncharacterized protein YqgV (UPF0045/DUF77 family)
MLGDFDDVMAVVKRCHQALREDETRVNTVLKINDQPGLEAGAITAKRERVEQRLDEA